MKTEGTVYTNRCLASGAAGWTDTTVVPLLVYYSGTFPSALPPREFDLNNV